MNDAKQLRWPDVWRFPKKSANLLFLNDIIKTVWSEKLRNILFGLQGHRSYHVFNRLHTNLLYKVLTYFEFQY